MSALAWTAEQLLGGGPRPGRPAPGPRRSSSLPRVPCPVGERFGRLTVLGEARRGLPDSAGKCPRRWTCRCDCGNVRDMSMGNIRARAGTDQSCGCNRGLSGRFTSERNPNARWKR